MKITKFVHSCLLVEMPAPVNRTVLFDPGMMSEGALMVDSLEFLDDIIITHVHGDHMSPTLIKKLVTRFPEVRITGSNEVAAQLEQEGIAVSTVESDGIVFFDAPHEDVSALFPQPEQIAVHYLDTLTDPGDSHSFYETKAILALPVTAPWGATIKAVQLAIELKPGYVLPIHDWHWSEDARSQMYDIIEQALVGHDITFLKLKTGEPVVIEI